MTTRKATTVANNEKNEKPKKKRGNNGNGFKPGQSGNPKGRPKEGESQAAIISAVLNMTPAEIMEMVGKSNDLGRAFVMMPKDLQVKYLMPIRAVAAFMFEPNNSLWNTILERTEGKVRDTLALTDPNGGALTINVNLLKDD